MSDLAAMLERQAAWQRARATMTWTEKLRLASELRKAAIAMRTSGKRDARTVAEERTSYGLSQIAARKGKVGE